MDKDKKGKGGNFDSRPNPFGAARTDHIAPSLTEVGSFGGTLDAICSAGCAIMVGHTRDGGAVVLTVLDGDNRHRTYCSNQQELDNAFGALWEMYGEG